MFFGKYCNDWKNVNPGSVTEMNSFKMDKVPKITNENELFIEILTLHDEPLK